MTTDHSTTRRLARRRAPLTVAIGMMIALLGALPATAAAASTVPGGCSPQVAASVNTELTDHFGRYGDTAKRWTGADSAYSVKLPDRRTAWIYSDTFLGVVNPDHSRPLDSPFVHNSIVVDDNGKLTTYTGGTAAAPESLVKVAGGDESQDWYWFGDATVEGTHLRVLMLEFEKTGTGSFDFAFVRTAVASFRLADMSLEGVTPLPAGTVEWASAIYEDAAYTYVYGIEDLGARKYVHLARVARGSLTSRPWEYLGGSGWVKDASASKRVLEGAANEFSVTRFQGRFALVTSDATEALSAKIVLYTSTSPEGPFGGKTVLYQTPETNGNVFTYNAKAHPELGDGHTLLVTYNVNSFDTNDVYADVDNYRPRYINVEARMRNCG